MSLVLQGSTSGSITLQEPAVAGTTVLDLPATSGTLITTGSSGQVIPKAALPTGSVLQVVQATFSGTQAVSGASAWTDVTSLSASITPTSSSSKILVSFAINCDGENNLFFRILRGATAIGVGDAAGNRQQVSAANGLVSSNANGTLMMMNQYLDSPATTSSTTYKMQLYVNSSDNTGSCYINYASGDGNNAYSSRCMSTLTLMEIAA